jgi:hypothetical protein
MADAVLYVLVPVGLFVLVVLLWAWAREHANRDLWRRVAQELGFSYQAEDPETAALLFGERPGLKVENVLRGKAQGLEVIIVEMQQGGSRETAAAGKVSVVGFIDEQARWPAFWLHSRQLGHQMSGTLGEGRLLFENDPAFARTYMLEAENELAVSELFTEEVRDWFARRPGLWVQASNRLLLYSPVRLLQPLEVRWLLQEGFEVLNLLQPGEQAIRE